MILHGKTQPPVGDPGGKGLPVSSSFSPGGDGVGQTWRHR